MSRGESIDARSECTELLHRFYRALDAGDFQGLTELMLPDGVWERQGKRLVGREAVLQALGERPPGRVTAHLVNNLVVDPVDDRTVNVSAYIVVLRHDADAKPTGPVPVPPIGAVQLCSDKLVLTDDGWRIAEKTAKAIFRHSD